MRRRGLLILLGAGGGWPRSAEAQRRDPGGRDRELDAWWARQRDKEAADRFWNRPQEQRRNATRDQIERWEERRGYRGQGPTGLAGPNGPYGPYRRDW